MTTVDQNDIALVRQRQNNLHCAPLVVDFSATQKHFSNQLHRITYQNGGRLVMNDKVSCIYRVKYEEDNSFAEYPFTIQLELTAKHCAGTQRNLTVRLGDEALTFGSRLAETRMANRLRELIQRINVGVPNTWVDHSQTCDGWSEDLVIEFGYNLMRFHWFCKCPNEWGAIDVFVKKIVSIANKLKK
jgi:hypothetical protein